MDERRLRIVIVSRRVKPAAQQFSAASVMLISVDADSEALRAL